MVNTQELLTMARTLGESLAAHPTVKAYYDAQRAARSDPAAQTLLRDYQAQLTYVQQLEEQQRPIEVADKQKLKTLEGQMAANEALKTLMRCQTDFVALMSNINRAIDDPLASLGLPERPA